MPIDHARWFRCRCPPTRATIGARQRSVSLSFANTGLNKAKDKMALRPNVRDRLVKPTFRASPFLELEAAINEILTVMTWRHLRNWGRVRSYRADRGRCGDRRNLRALDAARRQCRVGVAPDTNARTDQADRHPAKRALAARGAAGQRGIRVGGRCDVFQPEAVFDMTFSDREIRADASSFSHSAANRR